MKITKVHVQLKVMKITLKQAINIINLRSNQPKNQNK